MLNHVSRTALAAAALVLTGTHGAFAQDATAFADRLVEASKLMGISFSYGSATAEGDTITISDFTFAIPGEEPTEVPGDVVFEGVVETPEGGFTAERATIADIEHTSTMEDGTEGDEMTLNLVDIVAEGIELPADVSVENAVDLSFTLYDRISAGPLTVTDAEGTEVFSVASFATWVEEPDADGGVLTGYAVDGISADLSAVEDPSVQPMIEAFGIEQFGASMSGEGTWWPDTGRVEASDMSIVLDNLGSLHMAFAVEGYTREIYQELIKLNVKMAELAEAGEEIDEGQLESMSQAATEMMADIALASGSLRYEDNSLFMKVLDFIGAEQGVDGETFKAGLAFMVPMMLTEVEDEAFKTMVSSAVNTFIADPQNFTISVEPETPIAFSEFEARAAEIEADPFVLVDMLNVQVSANDEGAAAQ